MDANASDNENPRHYFVDEAGDGVLFDGKGRALPGSEGCSTYFMVGLLLVREPAALTNDLLRLRQELLADPYLAGVPSMQPDRRKTALAFHAKDDVPEVRREVFRALRAHDVSFFAVVRDKRRLLDYVRQRNEREPAYRYRQNELYDGTVRRLFKERLHQHERYRVVFASRGHSDRTRAFADALTTARDRFAKQWGMDVQSEIEVVSSNPRLSVPLQATDYFLWALQRLYERREDRYWNFVAPQASLVIDADDLRGNGKGVYYTKKKPLTLAALEEVPGI